MRQPVELRASAGVEIESDAHLLAIDSKMTFTVAGLLFGIGKGDGHGSGCGYKITFAQSGKQLRNGLAVRLRARKQSVDVPARRSISTTRCYSGLG
jgi:hypothetical protein